MSQHGKPISPTCCEGSQDCGVVELFFGASGQVSWVARPYDTSRERMAISVQFCPICGRRLTAEHIPFEGVEAP